MRARLRKSFGLKQEGTSECEIELLDTVEGSIMRAGMLLARDGDSIRLYELDTYLDFRQPIASSTIAEERFYLKDIRDAVLRKKLSFIKKPRAILAFSKISLEEKRIVIRNSDRKTVVRWKIQTVRLGEEEDVGLLGVVCSLSSERGYGKEFRQAVRSIQDKGQSGKGIPQLLEAVWRCRDTIDYGFGSKIRISLNGLNTCGSEVTEMIVDLLLLARSNETGIIEDVDTEFLHDYRVCIRKIRSLLSLVKGVYADEITAQMKRAFKALGCRSNRLRDLDVYLLEEDAFLETLPPSLRPGLVKMFECFENEREKERRAVSRYLKSKRYESDVLSLLHRFDGSKQLKAGLRFEVPVGREVCSIVRERYRKVCRAGRKIDDQTPDEKVHELRIHCKKLRYAMELFAPLFDPKGIQRLVRRLKKLQDVLGAFNDAAVQQENLIGFLSDTTANDTDMIASIGGLVSVLNLKQRECRAQLRIRFETFNSNGTKALFEKIFGEEGAF